MPPPLTRHLLSTSLRVFTIHVGFRCIISKSNHLEITDLVSEDAGSYSCKALNEFGNYTLNFTLKVLKPTTLNTSEVVVAIRGRPAVFIAQVRNVCILLIYLYEIYLNSKTGGDKFSFDKNVTECGLTNTLFSMN